MWQMISIDEDAIKLISTENITSLVYGVDSEYKNSVVKKWLDDYFKTFKDVDMYFANAKWCDKEVDTKEYKCTSYTDNTIGLLSIEEYVKAGASNSFIPLDEYWWTINYDSNKTAFYINNNGQINNDINDKENYFSFGVRPVISLSKEISYKKGDGSITNPYVIGEVGNVLLRDNYVGNYVKYKDMLFKIVKTDETGTELMLDNVLENKTSFTNIYSFLTKEFLSTLDTKELVRMNYNVYNYKYSNKYNYKEVYKKDVGYVKIPAIGDYFIVEYGDCWLNNIYDKSEGLYYIILENNVYFSDLGSSQNSVRPIIKLDPNLIIDSGIGTKDDPILIGGSNEDKA
jgi:hypothetical protein